MKLDLRAFAIISIVCLLLQVGIISYNHFTGFIHVTGPVNFVFRVLFGAIVSLIISVYLFMADSRILTFLEKRWPWRSKFFKRFFTELVSAVLISSLGAAVVTAILHLFIHYRSGLMPVILINSIIASAINLAFISVFEAVLAYKRGQESALRAEKLEKENAVIRLDTLKSQLNPHFMFNSLNSLSGLLSADVEKAHLFIEEFSSIYRYTLECIDKPLITVEEELRFAESFFYLQGVRFGDAIIYSIDVSKEMRHWSVPPLAVQTVLENAFKHNKATVNSPLKVSIESIGNKLKISNTLQPRTVLGGSTGIGLSNLKKRYAIIGIEEPEFYPENQNYISILPMIEK